MAERRQVELWRCEYPARCKQTGCRAHATVIVRDVDNQDRPLRQMAYCELHAGRVAAVIAVRDMR